MKFCQYYFVVLTPNQAGNNWHTKLIGDWPVMLTLTFRHLLCRIYYVGEDSRQSHSHFQTCCASALSMQSFVIGRQ